MANKYYYEFDRHEYYGLIVVSIEEFNRNTAPYKKAASIYIRDIGGESVEEVLREGYPTQLTPEKAFKKFMYAPNHQDETVKTLIKQFEGMTDSVLLIDGSLI